MPVTYVIYSTIHLYLAILYLYLFYSLKQFHWQQSNVLILTQCL